MILFETNVGSHMWGMNHKDSDFDIFQAFVVDTKELLRGTADVRSQHVQKGVRDYAIHEIGHVINYCLKGNVNFMWGIHSPYVLRDQSMSLKRLRSISLANLSKNTYHSIKGLALKNMKKYILTKETPPDVRAKKGKIIARTLLLGISLLNLGELQFEPVNINIKREYIEFLIGELDTAYENSNLPEEPDEKPFRDYLQSIREKRWTK